MLHNRNFFRLALNLRFLIFRNFGRWRMFNYHLVVFIELPLEYLHHLLFTLHNIDVRVLDSRILLLRCAYVMKNLILLKLSWRAHHLLCTLGNSRSSIKIECDNQFGLIFANRLFFFAGTRTTGGAAWLFLSLLSPNTQPWLLVLFVNDFIFLSYLIKNVHFLGFSNFYAYFLANFFHRVNF